MIKRKHHLLIFLIGTLLTLLVPALRSAEIAYGTDADSILWTEPEQLSNPFLQAGPPAITSDIAGNVHIMWSERLVQTDGEGDTLFYLRLNQLLTHQRSQSCAIWYPMVYNHLILLNPVCQFVHTPMDLC